MTCLNSARVWTTSALVLSAWACTATVTIGQDTPTCGNGVLDDGEQCDDGVNDGGYGGCMDDCTLAPHCGDGILTDTQETCDDGNTIVDDGCSDTCQVGSGYVCPVGEACVYLPNCGDGTLDPTEICDDGNNLSTDGCAADCSAVESGFACPTPGALCVDVGICGNGLLETGEACDDGNLQDADGCAGDCLSVQSGYGCFVPGELCTELHICGNGIVELGEACDDGNAAGTDGCAADCRQIESGYLCPQAGRSCVQADVCGNGLVESGEACDDRNTDSGDGCDSACASESGWVCAEPGEACVQADTCGNGILDTDEDCDDGNTLANDGCAADCSATETGFTCPAPGEFCVLADVCGNGLVEDSETCDDGNAWGSDGCSGDCKTEDGYSCTDPGEACMQDDVCGNGTVDQGEVCDDGNTWGGDGCAADCLTSESGYSCPPNGGTCIVTCGNGVEELGEACDDGIIGNDGSYGGCNANCTLASHCGDGVPDTDDGELCDLGDDANDGSYGGCNANCTLASHCGDGVPDTDDGELCDLGDDANDGSYGGCNANCTLASHCGDGNHEPSDESCDDGNAIDDDGCTDCILDSGYECLTAGEACTPLCGNGLVDDGTGGRPDNSEECDQTAALNVGGYGGCTPLCQLAPHCGDNTVQVGDDEVCDDGDAAGNDGCSANCQAIEPGYACPEDIFGNPIGGFCTFLCGNGIFGDGALEFCDDGNNGPGDGCNAICMIEPGFVCPVPGQLCERCGDGVTDTFETCDDGNRIAGDGCNGLCQLEPGWDCGGSDCGAAQCGDGYVAGVEQCDDGNRQSGDGCSFTCQRETGYTCPSGGGGCRLTICGDSAIEGDETCDDGNTIATDGCDANCQLELGYVCPTPGSVCDTSTCGNQVLEGLEQCDDGELVPDGGDGCDADCQLEPGYVCEPVGVACTVSQCGNGDIEGLEECDDGATDDNDGCSASCTIEGLYRCEGEPSNCAPVIEYVQISEMPAPLAQPQGVHYDPTTRSFIAYGFNISQGNQEFCLNGTPRETAVSDGDCGTTGSACDRPRYGIGDQLDGATYDPFTDRFLFIQQSGRFTAVDRETRTVVGTLNMVGLGTAGGIAVGNDGNIYACNHFGDASGTPDPNNTFGYIRMFARADLEAALGGTAQDSANCTQSGGDPIELCSQYIIDAPTDGPYLDNLFTIPGDSLVGYYNVPPGGGAAQFAFHDYEAVELSSQGVDFSSLDGRSFIPGLLFLDEDKDGNPVSAFPAKTDGGEAAADGGYFLVCSEYLTNSGNNNGVCKLFATTCSQDSDCYNRVPGTACNVSVTNPYCHLPERARVDRFTVDVGAGATELDVLANDSFGDGICTGDDTGVDSVTATSLLGGTVTVSSSGVAVDYTPPPTICGRTDMFSYTGDLGDDARTGDPDHTADVFVFIACVCGNNNVDPGEDCDDGATAPGDGCDANCQFEPECGNWRIDPGEACDDGNTEPGDGCSPTCQSESICGDGQITGIETCDDGNIQSGDGCRSNCTLEDVCGDNLVEGDEQCDDGNVLSGDGCSPTCTLETCVPLDGSCSAGAGDCCEGMCFDIGIGLGARCYLL